MMEDLEKTIKEKKNRKSILKKEIEDLEIEIDRFQDKLYKKEDEDSELEEELLSLEEKLYNIKSFNKIKGKILKDGKK
jgi:predicted  nucleic acid-binding Zn-ribbon protein